MNRLAGATLALAQMREVQFIEDDLGHKAYASPKVAQSMIEPLGPN
jgi:hypothetical protein